MNFKEVAKRAETGPLMEGNDFLMKRVAANVVKLQKKYDIRWDGKTLINLDDDLADRCWAAGKELLLTAGFYSANSRRVIEFAPQEVEHALRFAPSRLTMGQGKDVVTIHHRDVEDPRLPFIFSGPFNADVHEDMFVKLNEAFAQERIIDCLFLPGNHKVSIRIHRNRGTSLCLCCTHIYIKFIAPRCACGIEKSGIDTIISDFLYLPGNHKFSIGIHCNGGTLLCLCGVTYHRKFIPLRCASGIEKSGKDTIIPDFL